MTLRFCSGSVTSLSRSRNRSAASTKSNGSCSLVKRSRTCAASFSRSRPLSTKMHVNRSPIARCTSSAATVESTPPERPSTTRPSPDLFADPRHALLDERRHRPVAVGNRTRRTRNCGESGPPARCARLRDGTAGRRVPRSRLLDRGHGRVGRRRDDLEPWRRRRDEVAVARPDLERWLHGSRTTARRRRR